MNDSIEVVAIVAGALVGIAGVVGTVLTARGGRKHAERLAQDERAHALRLARAERIQARRGETYVEILEVTAWVMEIVERTQPIMEPAPPPPDPPDEERLRPVQARIAAHGSAEVKEILDRWKRARIEFFVDAEWLARIRATPPDVQVTIHGKRDTEKWREVEDKRRELRQITRELEDRVNAELAE